MNKTIKEELEPGEIEQIVVFADITNLSQGDLFENYSEVIKLFQMIYPSRLHKMYVKMDTQSSIQVFVHLEKFFYEYNKNKIVVFDVNNIKNICEEIDSEIVKQFFILFRIESKKSLNENILGNVSINNKEIVNTITIQKTKSISGIKESVNYSNIDSENLFNSHINTNIKDCNIEDFKCPLEFDVANRFYINGDKINNEENSKNEVPRETSWLQGNILKAESCNNITIMKDNRNNNYSDSRTKNNIEFEITNNYFSLKTERNNMHFTNGTNKSSFTIKQNIRKNKQIIFERSTNRGCCLDSYECIII
jgi:hypothetical protein